MSEKFKRGSIVTNKNGDEFDCKVVILVTGDRSTSDHHFSGVCIQSYNKKIHPVGDFSTTWHLEKFFKLYDSFEEWQSESPAEQPVVPTFWDVAKAFKWAAEHKTDKGESLMLADGWCLMSDGGVNEELTPGNVAELYCLQNGFEKNEQPVREVDKGVIEFIRDVAENWDCDPDSHTYNLRCRKCEATKLYNLFKEQKEKG